MKTLYLLTWEFGDVDRECEWTHFVSDKEVIDYSEQLKIVKEFMEENHEESPEDYDIENVWLNSVTQIDGYKITVGDKSEA